MMPKSIKDSLVQIRSQLHSQISLIPGNSYQCQILLDRVDQLIDPLERLEHSSTFFMRDETRPILENLLVCLDQCNQIIEKQTLTNSTFDDNDDKTPIITSFDELNTRLSQLTQDLSLGLHIQSIFERREEQENQRFYLQDLNKQIQNLSEQLHSIHRTSNIDENFIIADSHNDSYYQSFLRISKRDLRLEESSLSDSEFADIHRGLWLTHDDEIVMKTWHVENLSDDRKKRIQENFARDVSIMCQMRYENVIQTFGIYAEKNIYAIIMEYMPLGSLFDVLQKKIDISWSDRYSLAWQMAKSINYLHHHQPSIIHQHIHSKNFLLKYNQRNDQHRFHLKVTDIVPILDESFVWKAPELLQSATKHTRQSDIYSLGVTLWELGTSQKPEKNAGELKLDFPAHFPRSYQQTIRHTLVDDPYQRPICSDLMRKFFRLFQSTLKSTDEKHLISSHSNNIDAIEQVTPTGDSDVPSASFLINSHQTNGDGSILTEVTSLSSCITSNTYLDVIPSLDSLEGFPFEIHSTTNIAPERSSSSSSKSSTSSSSTKESSVIERKNSSSSTTSDSNSSNSNGDTSHSYPMSDRF